MQQATQYREPVHRGDVSVHAGAASAADDWRVAQSTGLSAALDDLKRCLDILHGDARQATPGDESDDNDPERLAGLIEDGWSEHDAQASVEGWENGALDGETHVGATEPPDALPAAATDAVDPVTSASSLSLYLNEIRAVPPLSQADEKLLALRIREGDQQAAAQMIRAHLGLVVVIARSLRSPNMPLEDLIGDGNMGLIEAVSRFDPERGVLFGTYARFWIKQSIRQGILNHSRTVRLPVHVIREVTRVLREQRKGRPSGEAETSTAGSAPTELGRIAQATGKTVHEVVQLMGHAQRPLSMDLPVGGEESLMLADTIEDTERGTPESQLVNDQMLDTLLACVNSLSRVERVVVLRRYGFETGEPDTLENVGSLLGLTAERVRQIQKAALPKLREALLQRGMDAAALFG